MEQFAPFMAPWRALFSSKLLGNPSQFFAVGQMMGFASLYPSYIRSLNARYLRRSVE